MYVASLLVLITIILTFCIKDIKQQYEQCFKQQKQEKVTGKIAQLENSGKLPKLERNNSLAGINKDGNRIRDDIVAYIEQQYPQEVQKVAKQFAHAMQKSVLDGVRGDQEVAGEKITSNTRQRLKAYNKFNTLLGNATWASKYSKEEGCEDYEDE